MTDETEVKKEPEPTARINAGPKGVLATIKLEEYRRLQRESILLEAMLEVGVDSWDGYEEAQLLYEEKCFMLGLPPE